MNYKAELRGFGLDRALRLAEANKEKLSTEEIFKRAEEIVDYLYIPEKDIDSHLKTLLPLIGQTGDVDTIEKLILTLEQMKAEIEANISQVTQAEVN